MAVVFVTGMIVWMNDHARGMKATLEREAAEAISEGGATSLAVMAFLAVLKEGFETSVFLLATFSVAQSARTAAIGAVLGIAIAAVIGVGIYLGGIRINLGKFFRTTGAFLIVVAAGLTLQVIRTAHEAGWITAGQQKTIDLTWLVQPGTVRSALITGVLGIPADPRLIEVIGWFGYLVPISLYVYWPRKWRPQGINVVWTKAAIAGLLLVAALGLRIGYPDPAFAGNDAVNLVAADGDESTVLGTARLVTDGDQMSIVVALDGNEPRQITLEGSGASVDIHNGLLAQEWVIQESVPAESRQITLNDLVDLNGDRLPIGVDANRNPGPFTLTTSTSYVTTVWVYHGVLLDAAESSKSIAEISDGGLDYPRTINASKGTSTGWAVSSDDRSAQSSAINDLDQRESEHKLWARDLPILLGIVAMGFTIAAVRTFASLQRGRGQPPDAHAPPGSAAGART